MKRPETKIPSVSGAGVMVSCRICAGISRTSNSTVRGAQIMIASVATSTRLCSSDMRENSVEKPARERSAAWRSATVPRRCMSAGGAIKPPAMRTTSR
jgi:hypothetical protein